MINYLLTAEAAEKTVTIIELVILGLIFGYVLFAFLVVRQIDLLVNHLKTNLSRSIYVFGILNILIGILAFIASLSLVF